MDIVREPEGVDLTVVSKPNTPEDAAMMTAWIQADKKRREATAKPGTKRISGK